MAIHISHVDHWENRGDTWVSGSAFFGDEHFSNAELAERISATDSDSELKRVLSRANGFFSVIHDTGRKIYAAVDHVRSWPIYYTESDDVYVSDSAEWVHENGARRGYDPVAGTEYLFTGFVSGRDTLSRDVKQVRAGEVVTLHPGQSSPNVGSERYFLHNPRESSSTIDEDELDEVLVEAVNRLIEYADGRTILLGLSSGYDSRLIALLLHRLGYDHNTVAYTGHTAAQNPEEVSTARSIARDLDFEHVEITEHRSDYQNIDGTEQMDLVHDIGYLSEYPSINKVIQCRKFREAGIDPDDAVHVLGHQLLGAGTFLPAWVRDQNTLSRNEFFDLMWTLHYSHWEMPDRPQWRRLFEGRMLDRVPDELFQTGTVESTPDAMGGFEHWYWQERLPKYIIIRREYAYLGFDVWYPLLDRGLFSLFESSNHQERVGKRVLKEYVRQLDVEIRGERSDLAARNGTPSRSVSGMTWDQMVEVVHALPDPATQFIRQTYNEYQSMSAYEQEPRYRIVSEDEFDSISFPNVSARGLHRPLLLLHLYKKGFFDFPVETEFDRAFSES